MEVLLIPVEFRDKDILGSQTMILPEGRKTLAPTYKFFLMTIFRNKRGTSIKKRPFLKRGIFLEGGIKNSGRWESHPVRRTPSPA